MDTFSSIFQVIGLCLCNLAGHAMSTRQLLESPHVGTTAMQCSEDLEIRMGPITEWSLIELSWTAKNDIPNTPHTKPRIYRQCDVFIS